MFHQAGCAKQAVRGVRFSRITVGADLQPITVGADLQPITAGADLQPIPFVVRSFRHGSPRPTSHFLIASLPLENVPGLIPR